ncbi:MAG: molecular chaperone HtpG, partial [Chlamydiia bacterium]|nr:molecular chaperone HtpG [Chlamydiia bacterium]
LNVSRSYLQMDSTIRQLGSHLSKKISDRLSALYRSERERFISYWEDIEIIIKYGALQDEKFYERAKEFLIFKTFTNEWMTIEEYIEKHPSKTIYYTSERGHFLELYKEKNIEVLFVRASPIDQALIQMLEKKTGALFKRIDGHMDEHLLDSSKEKGLLDADGRSEAGRMAEFFKKKLEISELEVEAKSLATPTLPAFLLLKEEERRLRDSLAYHNRLDMSAARGFIKPTFVINTNNKLIQAIHTVGEKDPDLAKQMVREVYDLACLSQREMEPEGLSEFVSRSTAVLENLAVKICTA